MGIRLAKAGDASAIEYISRTLSISRNSTALSGFVDFPPISEECFTKRIRNNPHFFVAEENGTIVGFSSGYTTEALRADYFKTDPIAQNIIGLGTSSLYWEQIAVIDSKISATALLLARNLVCSAGKRDVWTAIVSHPRKNSLATRLAEKFGFSPVCPLYHNNLVFQLYCLPR